MVRVNSAFYSADFAEEMIPSMSYHSLVQNLGDLTEIGAIGPENPTTLLVIARLVDRNRIRRSGITAKELSAVLTGYKTGKTLKSVIRALEQAVEIALENETQPAAYSAR